MNFKEITITEDVSINWRVDYHVTALNLETLVFEDSNDFCYDDNLTISIEEEFYNTHDIIHVDEMEISDVIRDGRWNGINFVYALYCTDILVGFVYENYK